jgi:hypothetical protein
MEKIEYGITGKKESKAALNSYKIKARYIKLRLL